MKVFTKLVLCLFCAGVLAACASEQKEDTPNNRKIYLTEEDYMEDLSAQAAQERREAPPAAESEYIFNAVPETEKNVYFYDERQQPKVPGQPSDSDYKKEKRLWEKPKRYTPEQYYGMQEGSNAGGSSSRETEYDY